MEIRCEKELYILSIACADTNMNVHSIEYINLIKSTNAQKNMVGDLEGSAKGPAGIRIQ